MNFLNSYISTFNKQLTAKKFLITFLAIISTIILLSFILNRADFITNGNDTIRQYQLSKIDNNNFRNVSTIIVGDSSAGNAINAQYFSKLSNQKTLNLSLTGSWGIAGSLGIIKSAYNNNKNLKNIIIIQTLDIWPRAFAKESILELYSLSEAYKILGLKSLVAYLFNPKEILWNLTPKTHTLIDFKSDYIAQKDRKYSNDLKKINSESSLNQLKVSHAKLKELMLLQKFCIKNELNCIYANGPIHNTIAKNSNKYFDYLDNEINNIFKIKYINKIFSYSNNYIGDSTDHIDIKHKDEVTKDYFNAIRAYLITQ